MSGSNLAPRFVRFVLLPTLAALFACCWVLAPWKWLDSKAESPSPLVIMLHTECGVFTNEPAYGVSWAAVTPAECAMDVSDWTLISSSGSRWKIRDVADDLADGSIDTPQLQAAGAKLFKTGDTKFLAVWDTFKVEVESGKLVAFQLGVIGEPDPAPAIECNDGIVRQFPLALEDVYAIAGNVKREEPLYGN